MTDTYLNIFIAPPTDPTDLVMFTNRNIVKAQVIDKLNQISTADLTLTGYYTRSLASAGFCEDLNQLPGSGKVTVGDIGGTEVAYSRAAFDPVAQFEASYQLWKDTGSGGAHWKPMITGPSLGVDQRAYIAPFPQEGSFIHIFDPWECIFTGTVKHFQKIDGSDQIRLICEGIEVYALKDLNVMTRTVYSQTDTDDILTAMTPKPIGSGVTWETDFDIGMKLDYALEVGTNYLMNLANLAVINGFDWWITVNVDYTIYTIHVREGKGSDIPVFTWIVRSEAFNLQRERDLGSVITSIVVSGSAQEVQNQNTGIIANNTLWAISSNETTLAANISATDTSVAILLSTGYEINNIIQLGTEKLTITNKVGNTLTVTRATGGTTAAAHYYGDDVLKITAITVSGSGFDPGGFTTARIGAEQITFASGSSAGIANLTRGTGGTVAYRHKAGSYLILGEEVQTTSPVGLYGIRTRRESAIGLTTRDGLDKYAGAILSQVDVLAEAGTFRIRIEDKPDVLEVGDVFTLTEYDTAVSADHRISGLTYDLPAGMMTIDYGLPSEWILANFADAAKAMALTAIPKSVSKLGAILALSSDNKMAQVQPNDGSATRWVRLKV